MAYGTVKFEKTSYTPITLVKTYFYKNDTGSVSDNTSKTVDVSTATFIQLFKGQSTPSTAAKVRGYEVYIDVTPTSDEGYDTATNEVVTRLAKVTTNPAINTSALSAGDYDVYISQEPHADKTKTLSTETDLIFKNISGVTANFRIVLIVEE